MSYRSAIGSVLLLFGLYLAGMAPAPASQAAPRPTADLRYAILGDAGFWNESTHQIRKSILDTGVRKLILAGDNLYPGQTYDEAWGPWLSHGFQPGVVAIGNNHGGYRAEVAYFKMPGQYYARTDGDQVRFIVLNSDNERTVREQAAFLAAQLEQATEPFVFVVYHHPPYTVNPHHPWTQKEAFHRATLPILKRHRARITALILGHDHVASVLAFGNLPAIISGASQEQAKARSVDYISPDDGAHIRTVWVYDPTPTWTQLALNPARREARFTFIDATTGRTSYQLTLKAPALRQTSARVF